MFVKRTLTLINMGFSFQLSERFSEETSVMSSLQRVKWNFVKLRQMRPKKYNFWHFLEKVKVCFYQCWQLTARSSCPGGWAPDSWGSHSSRERWHTARGQQWAGARSGEPRATGTNVWWNANRKDRITSSMPVNCSSCLKLTSFARIFNLLSTGQSLEILWTTL